MEKKCVMANDHGAVELAGKLRKHLEDLGYSVTYLGTDDPDVSVDYPRQAEKAVEEYRRGGYDFGVLLCGTGIGISIAANKFHGIRCALCQDTYTATMTKKHNNANFIAFGGRVEYKEDPEKILDAYLSSEFEGGRHQRRINEITEIERHC